MVDPIPSSGPAGPFLLAVEFYRIEIFCFTRVFGLSRECLGRLVTQKSCSKWSLTVTFGFNFCSLSVVFLQE